MYLVIEEDNNGRLALSVFHLEEKAKTHFDSVDTSWATPIVSIVQIEGDQRFHIGENGVINGAKLIEKKEENILV